METVTSLALQEFFSRLGERTEAPITFYLLGGSALCLLRSPRVNSILPRARSADIDPREFQAYFLTLKRNAGLAKS